MVGMKRLLLVGAGHAHAQVLKDWIRAPVPGTALTLVTPSVLAPYSGMVPGWLAGTYRFDEICIDFAALAKAAGADLLIDALAGLDPKRRSVRLRSGTELHYDLLSLNVGSTLNPPPAPPGTLLLPLRPLGRLHAAWEALLSDPGLGQTAAPLRVTAVGGGAAGVEALLATLARLRQAQPGRPVTGQLLNRGPELLPGLAPGAVRAAHAALAAAGVTVHTKQMFDATATQAGTLLLWATGAEAHAWQRGSGLALSPRGFVRIDARLRSVSHAQVFAVGDCAEWAQPLPKAGVFAVRMGPVLSRNLRAALGVGQAVDYTPQRRVLALLATTDGSAIGAWGRWAVQGRWVWRWKDRIDRGFLRRFVVDDAAPDALTAAAASSSPSDTPSGDHA
jgi:pyridine nucleotide-disulfide oxidoreductase family protein